MLRYLVKLAVLLSLISILLLASSAPLEAENIEKGLETYTATLFGDGEAPIGELEILSVDEDSVLVRVTAYDPGGLSSVEGMRIALSGNLRYADWEPFATEKSLPREGRNRIDVWARFRDSAGNISEVVYSPTVCVDEFGSRIECVDDKLYLPLVQGIPAVDAPVLAPIAPPDQNGLYELRWSGSAFASLYTLEEARNSNFTDAQVVYAGSSTAWTTPDRRLPGTYHYRVKAENERAVSVWSNAHYVVVAEPLPSVPSLHPIDNGDQNNLYSVRWDAAAYAQTYILEEASSAEFTDAIIVYEGSALEWQVPAPGKTPGFRGGYHYRVKARNVNGESAWSQEHSVVVRPLFVGYYARWDGEGFIRTDVSYNVGFHQEVKAENLIDADGIRVTSRSWYAPNPYGWPEELEQWYYTLSTGDYRSGASPEDPAWKWRAGLRLAYYSRYESGSTVQIGGQPFTVTGPHAGFTSYGYAVQYWEFVNQTEFVFHDDGTQWTQRVLPGEARLRYDAGPSGLQLYRDVRRTYYRNGQRSNYTVQYITNLAASNALPGGARAFIGHEAEEAYDRVIGSALPGMTNGSIAGEFK